MIKMMNGDYCWVEVSGHAVQVKRSKDGSSDVKMYEEQDAEKAMQLANHFGAVLSDITPKEIQHPLLRPLVNTVLYCHSLSEVNWLLKKSRS